MWFFFAHTVLDSRRNIMAIDYRSAELPDAAAGFLDFEQSLFPFLSPPVSAWLPALSDDSMTWDHQRNGIRGARPGYRARSGRRTYRSGDIGVGAGCAVRNTPEFFPHTALKSSRPDVQRKFQTGFGAIQML
jgi:hypothetical protein